MTGSDAGISSDVMTGSDAGIGSDVMTGSDAGIGSDVMTGSDAGIVSDVRIRKILVKGKMKAVASVTIANTVVIHDVKVVEGESGLFMAMPSRKITEGEFRDIAHPIDQKSRDLIQNCVLEAYHQYIAEKYAATETKTIRPETVGEETVEGKTTETDFLGTD